MKEETNKILPRQYSEKKIIAAYARLSRIYDVWGKLTESKAARKVIELADIKDSERILEVAVGTGMLFKEIVRMNRDGITEGIDISPAMLSRAQNRLKGIGTNNFHLQLGNAHKLPFKTEEFDLIINNFMLDLLPEESFDVVLSEFYRVLKPAGRVVISTMASGNKWYHAFWRWVARNVPTLLTDCRPIDIRPYLLKAGFGNVTVEFASQNTFPSEIVRAEKTGA